MDLEIVTGLNYMQLKLEWFHNNMKHCGTIIKAIWHLLLTNNLIHLKYSFVSNEIVDDPHVIANGK